MNGFDELSLAFAHYFFYDDNGLHSIFPGCRLETEVSMVFVENWSGLQLPDITGNHNLKSTKDKIILFNFTAKPHVPKGLGAHGLD